MVAGSVGPILKAGQVFLETEKDELAGIFREQDLVKDQKFNNFYEETKFLAEVEVQEAVSP